jgi:hypothetical protein
MRSNFTPAVAYSKYLLKERRRYHISYLMSKRDRFKSKIKRVSKHYICRKEEKIKTKIGFYTQRFITAVNEKKGIKVDIRHDAEKFLDNHYEYFHKFYRSSRDKKNFIKFLVGLKSLYSKTGVELPCLVYGEGIDVSHNSFARYIKDAIDLGFIECVSKSYRVGSFSRRYKCKSPQLHEVHVKTIHPKPNKVMVKKIKTLKHKLKLEPLREKAWSWFLGTLKLQLKENRLWRKNRFNQENLRKSHLQFYKKQSLEWDEMYPLPLIARYAYFHTPFTREELKPYKYDVDGVDFRKKPEPVLRREVEHLITDYKTPLLFESLDKTKLNLTKACYIFGTDHLYPYCIQRNPEIYSTQFLNYSLEAFDSGLSNGKVLTDTDTFLCYKHLGRLVSLYKFYPKDLLRDINKHSGTLGLYSDLWRWTGINLGLKAEQRAKPFLTLFANAYRFCMRKKNLWKPNKINKTKWFNGICDVINGVEYIMGAYSRKWAKEEYHYDARVVRFWNSKTIKRLETWKKVLRRDVILSESVKKFYQIITNKDLQHAWSRQRDLIYSKS